MKRKFLLTLLLYGMAVWPAGAHTIIFDAGEADKMAAISDVAPRMSWAAYEGWTAIYSASYIEVIPGRSFLIRFALSKIPPGQRITYAELILPVPYYTGTDPRFYLWRVLADWGPGVSYLYRRTSPAKQEWAVSGARGLSSDRATRPSAVVRLLAAGEQTINITEDIELWYSGAAPNHGWLFTVEDPELLIRFGSPAWDALAAWRLRITYEPE